MKQRLDKWRRWLHETIIPDVMFSLLYFDIFSKLGEMVQKNKQIQKPTLFHNFMHVIFSEASLIRLRRQIKNDSQSISLMRLLNELHQQSGQISRELFISYYCDSYYDFIFNDKSCANKEFDKIAAHCKSHIDSALVESDMNNLKSLASTCEEFVDKRVAHLDIRKQKRMPPKFKDLKKCFDFIEKLIIKYHRLLCPYSCEKKLTKLLPVDNTNWRSIFKKPWISRISIRKSS